MTNQADTPDPPDPLALLDQWAEGGEIQQELPQRDALDHQRKKLLWAVLDRPRSDRGVHGLSASTLRNMTGWIR